MSQETPLPQSNNTEPVNEPLNLNDINKALKDDSLDDKVDLLAEDEPEKTDKTDKKDEDEPELELNEEDEEPTEEDLALQTPPRKKEITAKYPNLFKEFPYLQAAFYREQQFTELFATPADAKETKERASEFDKFEQSLLSGNTESVLKSIKAADENAFAKIVDDYLPTLARTDEKAYFTVLGNVIKGTVQSMVHEAGRLNNEDLKAAALLLNQFVFGTSQFSEQQKFNKRAPEDNDKEKQLSDERAQFAQERFESVRADLSSRVDNILKSTIAQNIDPKGLMTDYVRKIAIKEAFDELESTMGSDARFRQTQDKLWEVTIKQNYTEPTKNAIRNGYLGKAKGLLPSILLKHRNEALKGLGKRDDTKDRKGPITPGRTSSAKSIETHESSNKGEKIPHSMRTLDFLNQD